MNDEQLDRAQLLREYAFWRQEVLIEKVSEYARTADGANLLYCASDEVAQLAIDEGLIGGYPVPDDDYEPWVKALVWHTLRACGQTPYQMRSATPDAQFLEACTSQDVRPELATAMAPLLAAVVLEVADRLRVWQGPPHGDIWWTHPVGLTAIATYLAHDGTEARGFALQPIPPFTFDRWSLATRWMLGFTGAAEEEKDATRHHRALETALFGPRLEKPGNRPCYNRGNEWVEFLPGLVKRHPEVNFADIDASWGDGLDTPGGWLRSNARLKDKPRPRTFQRHLKRVREMAS